MDDSTAFILTMAQTLQISKAVDGLELAMHQFPLLFLHLIKPNEFQVKHPHVSKEKEILIDY